MNKPRAVLVTAISLEYQEVRAHLSELRQVDHKGSVYEQGQFTAQNLEWDVLLHEIGKGNINTAMMVERAITFFSPVDVACFIGVAGGLKDVSIGDVVAATKVYAYEFGKEMETFLPRTEIGLSSHALIERARFAARQDDWLRRLRSTPQTRPRVFVEPIVTGEKVIASHHSRLYEFLKSHFSDAVAVEMEGYGHLTAVHSNPPVSALVIRGVSDLVEGKSEADARGAQQVAAQNAAAFAFEVLAGFRPSEASTQFNSVGRQSKSILFRSLLVLIPVLSALILSVVYDWPMRLRSVHSPSSASPRSELLNSIQLDLELTTACEIEIYREVGDTVSLAGLVIIPRDSPAKVDLPPVASDGTVADDPTLLTLAARLESFLPVPEYSWQPQSDNLRRSRQNPQTDGMARLLLAIPFSSARIMRSTLMVPIESNRILLEIPAGHHVFSSNPRCSLMGQVRSENDLCGAIAYVLLQSPLTVGKGEGAGGCELVVGARRVRLRRVHSRNHQEDKPVPCILWTAFP